MLPGPRHLKNVATIWWRSKQLYNQKLGHEHTSISGIRALIAATGVGYYFAKGVNEERWKDQRARGLRANPSDWKDKIATAEDGVANADAPPVEGGEEAASPKKGRGRIVL
ncbi:hypothetical protein CspeluHIS016_0108950 [Cutaneotrichosporon spelunceum]|uniref:Uncharacterized protein n=1 Tax=Cutaneotrichosporon spelunceum TaxID=1672016 RepID=A0AAD3YA34_9TREE|nr:hypothetical protein CspeluHIS016_0108950 [Cutaneotrichosporon spelunceum]